MIVKGILFTGKSLTLVEFDDTIENYQKMLDCKSVEVLKRKIGGHYYNIILDKNRNYKREQFVTGIKNSDKDVKEILLGKMFIVKGEHREFDSLSKRDLINIAEHSQIVKCNSDYYFDIKIKGSSIALVY